MLAHQAVLAVIVVPLLEGFQLLWRERLPCHRLARHAVIAAFAFDLDVPLDDHGRLEASWNSFEHQWEIWKPMNINKIQNTIETQNKSSNKKQRIQWVSAESEQPSLPVTASGLPHCKWPTSLHVKLMYVLDLLFYVKRALPCTRPAT